jgi:signal transduction histidine kinase
VLSVEDTGRGIAADDLDRIFEPYFTTRRDGGGTGLGLSIVRRLATRWRGFVTVDSAPGRGALFQVWLPRAGGAAR